MSTSTTADIMHYLTKSQSQFIFDEDTYKDYKDKVKVLDKNQVLYLYDSNFFNDSMLKIANIVANHVFATFSQIKTAVNIYNDRKEIEDLVPLGEDTSNLKNHLRDLVKANILRRYSFEAKYLSQEQTIKTRKLYYYLVTPHGYNYLKRILGFNKSYDEYLSITPLDEVFKYLACNNIVQELQKSLNFKSIESDKRYFSKNLQNVVNLYAEIILNNKHRDYKVLVEPIRFHFNKNRISQTDWDKNIQERFNIVNEYFEKHMIDDTPYVIFVCEDIDGIKKTAKIVKENLPNYINYCYYTTDAATFNGGIKNCCLKMVNYETGYGLNQEVIPFI